MERQDLSCTYLAHHELESVSIIIIIVIIIIIIVIIIILLLIILIIITIIILIIILTIVIVIIIGLPDLVPCRFANTTSGLTGSCGMPFRLLCFVLIPHAVMPYRRLYHFTLWSATC